MTEPHSGTPASRGIARWGRLRPLLVHLAALAAAVPALPSTADPSLSMLREAIEQSSDDTELRSRLQELAPVVGFTLSEQEGRLREEGRRFTLTFDTPLPARELSQVMGWERAYAAPYYGAHGCDWKLYLWASDFEDRGTTHIVTQSPRVGAWILGLVLDGPPQGELPELSAGGSPPYDLIQTYTANVTAVDLERWVGAWHPPEAIEVPEALVVPENAPPWKTDRPPRRADSTAEITGWIEARKGYGYPRYADVSHDGNRVFAAWNIPTSGFNATYYWVYCPHDVSGWQLVDAGTFVPSAEPAQSAVLDPERDELRFVGRHGQTYHRVSVRGCKRTLP